MYSFNNGVGNRQLSQKANNDWYRSLRVYKRTALISLTSVMPLHWLQSPHSGIKRLYNVLSSKQSTANYNNP